MALKFDDEFKHRLLPQATTLVEKAVGTADSVLLEVLLDACNLLENSSNSDTPIVAIERDARGQMISALRALAAAAAAPSAVAASGWISKASLSAAVEEGGCCCCCRGRFPWRRCLGRKGLGRKGGDARRRRREWEEVCAGRLLCLRGRRRA